MVLALWSDARGKSAHTLLSARWDALWYVRIVEHGYGFEVAANDGRTLSSKAFFPLFPWLERAVAAVLPVDHADAGLIISAVCSVLAAAGMFFLVDDVYGPRAALLTVTLWAALPVGIVQSMAYSESLFTALAVWALHLTRARWWPAAGALALLAGLARPVGLAVAVALWVAVGYGCSVERRRPRGSEVVGALLAPLGFLSFFLWVGFTTGSPWGYFRVQGGWGNGFDGGIAFARFIGGLLTGPAFAAGVLLLIGIGLLGRVYWQGFKEFDGRPAIPLPVQVYTGGIVLLALCSSGYFGSKPRLLLPAFALLIPGAAWLAKRPPALSAAAVTLLAVSSALYGAYWLNGSGPP
ncbi:MULTISPECIES: glycosyltransferase family 39 protein [unclassified Streptomyces]|uniref:glycosyltransferase family 39 protein n=1 Tax=unclassified Streptomyces TaxID=2593676 RepID=UPI002E2E3508|nr:glycosyltransferase family 39 protein [Streptomyces sp. NBC_01429]